MKIAIISDIHNNETRLSEALSICQKERIKTCICCGDIATMELVNKVSEGFEESYFTLGNMDFNLKNQLALFPENSKVSVGALSIEIDRLKIAATHYDYKAKELAKENKYDFIFYGHTHTPWEKKYDKTIILNPGEVAGERGKATFAIFDTETRKAELKLLK